MCYLKHSKDSNAEWCIYRLWTSLTRLLAPPSPRWVAWGLREPIQDPSVVFQYCNTKCTHLLNNVCFVLCEQCNLRLKTSYLWQWHLWFFIIVTYLLQLGLDLKFESITVLEHSKTNCCKLIKRGMYLKHFLLLAVLVLGGTDAKPTNKGGKWQIQG